MFVQLAGDPGDVVIADERHRHEVVEKLVVPHQRPVELVEVAVVEAAPDRLPQLVLGDGIEAGLSHPRRVVAVDDLTDEPRVAELLAHPGEDLRPEPVGDGVCGVQAPAVGAARQPVRHHVDGVGDDVGVVVVQGDQLAVSLEGVEVVAALTEPRRVAVAMRAKSVPTWLNTPSSSTRSPRWWASAIRWSKSASSPRRGSMR